MTEIVKIFYSSTEQSYLAKYRDRFKEICERSGKLLDVYFDIIYWKELPGGLGKTAQDVIDKKTVGQYEIYFGIMGTKFGKYTEHEYRLAVDEHIKNYKPVFVSFGFCEEPINPYTEDLKTFPRLLKFRQEIGRPAGYGLANLYFTFRDEREFDSRVEANLKEAVTIIQKRVQGGFRVKP